MLQTLRPGNDGEPLTPECRVIRLLRFSSMDEKVSPADFTESSSDNGRLSVYENTLTTPLQARLMMGNPSIYEHFASFVVGEARNIKHPSVSSPDVIWHPLSTNKPGYKGHCALVNMIKVPNLSGAKVYLKSIRDQLIEILEKPQKIEQ